MTVSEVTCPSRSVMLRLLYWAISGVVGHEYDGTSLDMQFLEKNQYLEGGTGIEVSGRFIGEDDGGVVYQCPGDGDTLHLSSGHLVAFMHQAVAQTYGNQRFDCFLCRSAAL